jgi:hypothetical protein
MLEVITARRNGWFTRADAVAAGYSDSELRHRVRSGQWLRLSLNSYVEPDQWPADEPAWERAARLHLLHLRSTIDRLSDVVVSHQSATMLHGLPFWGLDLAKSTSRVRRGGSGPVRRSLCIDRLSNLTSSQKWTVSE